jgi:hypothetical protein
LTLEISFIFGAGLFVVPNGSKVSSGSGSIHKSYKRKASSASVNQDNAYIPIDTNSQQGLGGFDSGTDKDWKDNSSAGAACDTW